jgi:hypothetical protein
MTVLQTIDLEDRPGVVLRLEILVCDLPLEGNVLCSGDEGEDAQAEQHVRDEWDHNDFCWCDLRVVAELENYPQIFGADYLGGVSILERFLPEGGTLEKEALSIMEDHDMISEAMQCLALDMVAAQDSIREFADAQGGVW